MKEGFSLHFRFFFFSFKVHQVGNLRPSSHRSDEKADNGRKIWGRRDGLVGPIILGRTADARSKWGGLLAKFKGARIGHKGGWVGKGNVALC